MPVLPFPLEVAAARPVRTPFWRLTIEGRDVTREISPMVLSATYVDRLHGESDELVLQLEDSSGRWRDTWLPEEGDRVELQLGYAGEPLLPSGTFEVDQLESAGPPDTLTIRALAAGPTPELRTKRTAAYEGQTLRQVAERVAARHGLRITGEIQDVRLARLTQHEELDLAFLQRIATDYAHVFSVRGDQLIFHELAALDGAGDVAAIRRGAVSEYHLEIRTKAVYKAVEVSYHDPETKTLIRRTVEAEGARTGDTYRLKARVETPAQAEEIARARLRWLQRGAKKGTLTLEGHPRLVAGSNATLSEFGRFDGRYQVQSSEHRMGRDAGYQTTVQVEAIP